MARAAIEKTLIDVGLTYAQFALLTMINAYPEATGADLARLTFLTPQTVATTLKNLEQLQAIVREETRRGAKRSIRITALGKKLLLRGNKYVHAVEALMLTELDRAAELIVRRWLATLAERLSNNL